MKKILLLLMFVFLNFYALYSQQSSYQPCEGLSAGNDGAIVYALKVKNLDKYILFEPVFLSKVSDMSLLLDCMVQRLRNLNYEVEYDKTIRQVYPSDYENYTKQAWDAYEGLKKSIRDNPFQPCDVQLSKFKFN